MTLTLEEIIQDLRALEARLRAYERKYGITSRDFYSLYQEGLLDDEGFEQSTEFARWASAYTMKLEGETAFEAASRAFVDNLRKKAAGRSLNAIDERPKTMSQTGGRSPIPDWFESGTVYLLSFSGCVRSGRSPDRARHGPVRPAPARGLRGAARRPARATPDY